MEGLDVDGRAGVSGGLTGPARGRRRFILEREQRSACGDLTGLACRQDLEPPTAD